MINERYRRCATSEAKSIARVVRVNTNEAEGFKLTMCGKTGQLFLQSSLLDMPNTCPLFKLMVRMTQANLNSCSDLRYNGI